MSTVATGLSPGGRDAGVSSRAPDEALAKLRRFRLPRAEVVPTGLNQLLTVWKI